MPEPTDEQKGHSKSEELEIEDSGKLPEDRDQALDPVEEASEESLPAIRQRGFPKRPKQRKRNLQIRNAKNPRDPVQRRDDIQESHRHGKAVPRHVTVPR
jgi:hypothetical protein